MTLYEKTIPETYEKQQKRAKILTHVRRAVSIFAISSAVLAIALLIGAVVLCFLLEFTSVQEELLFILMGSFVAGTLLFAVAAYFLMKAAEAAQKRRNDFLERCDSEASFFVGEGTLATFGEDSLVLHAEGKEPIAVPYGEMRFLSVCTRRAAAERGEWSVVLSIPVRYLTKGKKDDAPVLVQTEMKPRLLAVLKERGLALGGELPAGEKNRRFKAEKKFFLPHAKKRRNALLLLGAGILLAAACVPLWIFLDETFGAIAGMVGLILLGKGIHSLVRARAMLGIYPEGLFWRDTERTENVFLKWEEIGGLLAEEREGLPVLAVHCEYGAYRFPLPAGAWEYLEKRVPALCGSMETDGAQDDKIGQDA